MIMSKIFGLDLGQNSIGWAIINAGEISEMGTSVFPDKLKTNSKITLKQIIYIETVKILTWRQKLTLFLFSILTILTFVNISNWQFWFGLNFSTILTFLAIKE